MEGRDSAPHGTARHRTARHGTGTQRLCDAVRDVRVESRERRERERELDAVLECSATPNN